MSPAVRIESTSAQSELSWYKQAPVQLMKRRQERMVSAKIGLCTFDVPLSKLNRSLARSCLASAPRQKTVPTSFVKERYLTSCLVLRFVFYGDVNHGWDGPMLLNVT